ncbi:baseplate protein [Microcystis phage vB_MweS-yong2]|nr:baseplate protein [Microcystis phage vB_MweS-yong2]
MSYPVTITRAEAARPALPWTTAWVAADGMGDWRVAPANDVVNPGGLSDADQLASAVVISLFTDRRAPEGWREDVADRRGWWGDAIAEDGVTPGPIGSHLWLLDNEAATERNAQLARAYAEEALAWITEDRVAARVEVESGLIDNPRRGVWLHIRIFGRDGALVFDRRFARHWEGI